MSLTKRLYSLVNQTVGEQKKFAESIHISPNTFSHYITGRRKLPLDVAVKISEYTNCNLNWLLTGKGEMFLDGSIYKETSGDDNDAQREELVRNIKNLESEVLALKKSISELEAENSELTHELVQRLKKLCSLQEQLIPEPS